MKRHLLLVMLSLMASGCANFCDCGSKLTEPPPAALVAHASEPSPCSW